MTDPKQDLDAKIVLAHLAAEALSSLISEDDAESMLLERSDAMLANLQRRVPAVASGIQHTRTTVEGETMCIITVKGHGMPLVTGSEGYSAFVIGLAAGMELLGAVQNQEGN